MDTKPQDLPYKSMSAVKAGDRAGWVALFEEDALVEDPVGGHPYFDPQGNGHRGHEAIGRFYDMFSAGAKMKSFEVHRIAPGANEVGCFVTMVFATADGQEHPSDVISVYKMSENGRIASLRAFWVNP